MDGWTVTSIHPNMSEEIQIQQIQILTVDRDSRIAALEEKKNPDKGGLRAFVLERHLRKLPNAAGGGRQKKAEEGR